MVRTVFGKVMWVGRATVFLVGLAVVLALVVGVATTALGATGGNFILGKANAAGAVSKLTANVAGPALQLINNGTGAAATALNLTVASGKPPLTVNAAAGKATNLDADKVDGKEASDFYATGSKVADSARADEAVTAREAAIAASANNAANADRLDNKDSSVFAVSTAHAAALAHDCDTPNVWNECAPVTVTVPAGKSYIVSVWSSFSAVARPSSTQTFSYCSAGKGPSIDTNNPCVTPFGVQNSVRIDDSGPAAASSSGDTIALSPGTYTFFTGIKVLGAFGEHPNGHVITKVMVRDAANGL